MTTKLAQLRAFMFAGEWRRALKMAAAFPRLETHKEAIERGWAASQNPDFYRSIGRDPAELIAAGVAALKKRYGDPNKNFADGELK
jgi:hypothetical protein